MTGWLGQARRWARQGLLTVGAVLGVVSILMTLGAALFGLRPLVFESGSMSPTIETGDLAISRSADASSLEKGDIVSVPTGTGSRVTHRIVSIEHVGSDATLRLRGDANTATDSTPYRVSHADRVLFHVPRVGYAVGWLSGSTGRFLLGLYAAFLLSVLFRRSPGIAPAEPSPAAPLGAEMRVIPPSPQVSRRKSNRGKKISRLPSGGLTVVLMVGLAAGLVVVRSMTPTMAVWSESVGVTGTSLTADTVPATTLSCSKLTNGNGTGSSTVFSWTPVAGATDYTISFTGGSTALGPFTLTSTTYTDSSPKNNRVATVVVNRTFTGPPSVTWTSVPSNSRTETSNSGTCS